MDPAALAILIFCYSVGCFALGMPRVILPGLAFMAGLYLAAVLALSI